MDTSMELLSGDSKKIYTGPILQESKQHKISDSHDTISYAITNEFCTRHNLLVPSFVENILDIYSDFTTLKSNVESRGIMQLYTVYFLLHLISSYWTGIMGVKDNLLNNRNKITNYIMERKQAMLGQNFNPVTGAMKNSLQNDIKNAYQFIESILSPKMKNSNITIGIKYFLFQHPVNINWKYYDKIVYNCLILLVINYNLIYTVKTIKNFDEKSQKEIQKYVYDQGNKSNIINNKVFPQLFLLFSFMAQHSSRKPYKKDLDVESKMKNEKTKYNSISQNNVSNNVSGEQKQKLYNQIENEIQGTENNDDNSPETKTQTIGVYLILDIIFQLMYYHPFPYDASMLSNKSKSHPVDSANQQRKQELEDGGVKFTGDLDNEALEISADVMKFVSETTDTLIDTYHALGNQNNCRMIRGRKRCKLNPVAEGIATGTLGKNRNVLNHHNRTMRRLDNQYSDYRSINSRRTRRNFNSSSYNSRW